MTVFHCLKGSYREDGGNLFMGMPGNRTRGNQQNLLQGKVHLEARLKTTEHWKTLSREEVKSPDIQNLA